MLSNNWLATIITLIVAVAWLRLNDFAAHRGWISSRLSRKIIHAGTGPLFVLCWLLYNDQDNARYLAAMVPLLITIQFILVGLGLMKDQAAVQAMTRTGNPREILRGPLYYGAIFVIVTIIYWLSTPIGIIALMQLSGGDGLADIIGRRFGRVKLPWNKNKSWAGSLGMLLGGWFFSTILILVFYLAGIFSAPISTYLSAITIISIACTLIETLPIQDADNITITLTAIVVGSLLF